MNNILTIDVEDWYQTMDFNIDPSLWDHFEDRVVPNTERLLNLLEENGVRATFFILGYVAKAHPELVRKIYSKGHEIGSHGMLHRMVTRQTREEFREDVRQSRRLLEDITGSDIKLFRASSWSINQSNLWAFEILEEEGYLVDCSVQPFETPLSGMKSAPLAPYHPIIGGRELKLLEFPVSVLAIAGVRLPFAGGLYLRVMPASFISWAIRQVNKNRTAILYTHPWEYDPGQPKGDASWIVNLEHRWGLGQTSHKLDRLLKKHAFTTITESLSSRG